MIYTWGYHGSDSGHVDVALAPSHWSRGLDPQRDELFDVALYDREVIVDESTGLNAEDESLQHLRRLIGLANAALAAGLEPLPVPDKGEEPPDED
jgi:hypothetical protein